MIKSFFAAIVAAYLAFVGALSGGQPEEKITTSLENFATSTALPFPAPSTIPEPGIETPTDQKTQGTSVTFQKQEKNDEPILKKPPSKSLPLSTPATAPDADLVISNVRVIPGAYTVTLRWSTNLNANSVVTYWKNASPEKVTTRTTTNLKEHEIQLEVSPASEYGYLIEARNGEKIASVQEKKFETFEDVKDPIIEKVDLWRTVTQIFFKVKTDEPTLVSVNYIFLFTQNEEIVQTIASANFLNESTITFDMPSGWVPGSSHMKYEIRAQDRNGNSVLTVEKDIKFSDMVEI